MHVLRTEAKTRSDAHAEVKHDDKSGCSRPVSGINNQARARSLPFRAHAAPVRRLFVYPGRTFTAETATSRMHLRLTLQVHVPNRGT